MNVKKVVVGIVGAALVGGLTQAAAYFPNLVAIFTPAAALVLGVVAYVNGSDTS